MANSVFKYFQPSLFAHLQFEKVKLGGRVTHLRHRDIHFILADKALDDLDDNLIKKFLSPLDSSVPSADSHFDDDTLLNFCRSRYLQQPSDVLAYSNELDKFSATLRDYGKRLSSKYSSTPKSEPAKSEPAKSEPSKTD